MISMNTHQLSWQSLDSELPEHVDPQEHRFQQIKASIHQQLVESLDLSRVHLIEQERLERQLRQMADRMCDAQPELSRGVDRERLVNDMMAEVFGLGPLEALMEDPTISDILVNDPFTVYIERHGMLELTDVTFADEQHLMRIIQRIVARLGRRIDEVSPMVDARLADGSRVNAVIPPLAIDGPSISIRRFGINPLGIEDLLDNGTLLPEMCQFLAAAVEARIGCVISGGTGAGKTTLLNALSAYIPSHERIVTIEDSAELILRHRHRVRMETRPENTEGKGEITQRDLVRNSLRMRPDRIVVGEVRGPEVWDMLQAMNTGHEGSLTTIHANSSEDALARLEMMAALTGLDVPVQTIRQYIAVGIRLIIHVARLQGGVRRVTEITEIDGIDDGRYVTHKIFGFEQLGVNADGVARGQYFGTGHEPKILERIRAAGVSLPAALFQPRSFEAPSRQTPSSDSAEAISDDDS